jgi:tetratricopeptide (TPR) repeat protein
MIRMFRRIRTPNTARRLRGGVVLIQAFVATCGASSTLHAAVDLDEAAATARIEAARASFAAGDYADAIASYGLAIQLIEQRQTALSLELVEPLAELAAAQLAAQLAHDAAASLRRAVGIVRRNAGLYDLRQYELLLRLVDVQSQLGEIDGASDTLQYLQRLSAGMDDHGDAQQARSWISIADWRCRIGQFDEGWALYRRAIEALDERTQPAYLVRALVCASRCSLHQLSAEGVASTPGLFEQYRGSILRSGRMASDSPAFRFHGLKMLNAEGEHAITRAAQIAEGMLDERARVDVLLQAGDWFQMKDRTRSARRYYALAEGVAARALGPDRPLSSPVRLLYPMPPSVLRYRNAPADQFTEASVEVEFTVGSDGRIHSERVLSREAGKSFVDETLSALHVARFRPRFIDGRAVDTEGVRYREVFRTPK